MTKVSHQPMRAVRVLRRRVHDPGDRYVVLRRDLDAPLEPPEARVPLTVRPTTGADLPRIRALLAELLPHERASRERFLDRRIGTPFVAVDPAGAIAFVQWLVGPDQAGLIRALTMLPAPGPGEALVEGAFTPERFRGRGVMAAAMVPIAERARDLGARFVLTVVAEDNVASLRGCARAGFEPHLQMTDGWTLFRRRVRRTPVGTPAGHAG